MVVEKGTEIENFERLHYGGGVNPIIVIASLEHINGIKFRNLTLSSIIDKGVSKGF